MPQPARRVPDGWVPDEWLDLVAGRDVFCLVRAQLVEAEECVGCSSFEAMVLEDDGQTVVRCAALGPDRHDVREQELQVPWDGSPP